MSDIPSTAKQTTPKNSKNFSGEAKFTFLAWPLTPIEYMKYIVMLVRAMNWRMVERIETKAKIPTFEIPENGMIMM